MSTYEQQKSLLQQKSMIEHDENRTVDSKKNRANKRNVDIINV